MFIITETKQLIEAGSIQSSSLTSDSLLSVVEPKILQKLEFAKMTKEVMLKACKEAVSDILDLSNSSGDSKRKHSRRH